MLKQTPFARHLIAAIAVGLASWTAIQAQTKSGPMNRENVGDEPAAGQPAPDRILEVIDRTPANISGSWRGENWGQVELSLKSAKAPDDAAMCLGTYSDTFEGQPGTIRLVWLPKNQRFEGTWSEGKQRTGKLVIRLLPDGNTIRGSWTTDSTSTIQPGRPEHSDLEWLRTDAGHHSEAAADAERTVKLFHLQRANAADTVALLSPLYRGIRFAADSRTNAVLAMGQDDEAMLEIAAILLRLDETEGSESASDMKAASRMRPALAKDQVTSESSEQLKSSIDDLDARAIQLAQQIRQKTQKAGDERADVSKLRQELKQVLSSAMKRKLQWEQLRIGEMEARLSRLQGQLKVRQAASEQIVERRLMELLKEPDQLRWNVERTGHAAAGESVAGPARQSSAATGAGHSIVVDLFAPDGVWKNQNRYRQLFLDLSSIPNLTYNIRNVSGSGQNILMATIQVPGGPLRLDPVLKKRLGASLTAAGVQSVRWEDTGAVNSHSSESAVKPSSAVASPTRDQTFVQFKLDSGWRLKVDSVQAMSSAPDRIALDRREPGTRPYSVLLTRNSDADGPHLLASLEIYALDSLTAKRLENWPVPVNISNEDFRQFDAGNAVTKVVYLSTDVAAPVLATIASTRLEPGKDPLIEARQQGTVIAVFRLIGKTLSSDSKDSDGIWSEFGLKLLPTQDPRLLPDLFRGGLIVIDVDPAKIDRVRPGDVVVAMGQWEVNSIESFETVVKQVDSRHERLNQATWTTMYSVRDRQFAAKSIQTNKSSSQLNRSGQALVPVTFEQWCEMLARPERPEGTLGMIQGIRRTATLETTSRAATALLNFSESLDRQKSPELETELVNAARSLIPAGMAEVLVRTLKEGTERQKQIAIAAIKDLKDYASLESFPELAKLVMEFAKRGDFEFRITALNLIATTLPITALSPGAFSTEERQELVRRMTEFLPRDQVRALLIQALDDPNIDIALAPVLPLLRKPAIDGLEPEVAAKVVDLLGQVTSGSLKGNKASVEQRGKALTCMLALSSRASPAVPVLLELLKSDDPDLQPTDLTAPRGFDFTRERVINVLGFIGPAAKDALPQLELLLSQTEIRVQEDALLTRGGSGFSAPSSSTGQAYLLSSLKMAIARIKGDSRIPSTRSGLPRVFDN